MTTRIKAKLVAKQEIKQAIPHLEEKEEVQLQPGEVIEVPTERKFVDPQTKKETIQIELVKQIPMNEIKVKKKSWETKSCQCLILSFKLVQELDPEKEENFYFNRKYPYGEITIYTTDLNLNNVFQTDQEYYLDITKA